jgi:hypothetical protein
MFTVIGIIVVTLFFGWIAYFGLYLLIGYYSDYPVPLWRLLGFVIIVAALIGWYLFVGVHISIGLQ